ncbi:MAG: HAD family hydrolase [Porcipelethomonas sp.]
MINLIFDYDGTLHDCAKIYIPAFRTGYRLLTESGLAEYRYYTDDEIADYLGYSPKAMWERFMPELADIEKEKYSKIIGDIMLEDIRSGKAVLYDGTAETLSLLCSKGYRLIFLSNCAHDYMEAHTKAMGLDRFFSGFYCTGDFNMKPKYEIFETIKRDFEGKFAVIGDRFLDLQVAERHSLKSVGCAYGYGSCEELKNADVIVNSVKEIPDALRKIGL